MDFSASSTWVIGNKTVKLLVWDDLAGADWLPLGALDALMAVEPRSVIWTGWIGDKLMGICGYTFLYPHSVEWWSYLHPGMTRYPLFLHKTAKQIQGALRSVLRVQSSALVDQPAHAKWLERLGFHEEGPPMRYAGPDGRDLRRYVWFPQEGA